MKAGSLLAERFELEQRVGAGGMGEVFRAKDRVSDRTVAVKVLHARNAEGRARFLREAEVLADLVHPGIVRYLAHGTTPAGEPYLVMEWLEGEDLKQRLQRAPLTVRASATMIARVAEALGAAHALGVVHRDVKPGNLFLPGGNLEDVKVIDFGLARRDLGPEHGRGATQTGVLLGTPAYMAPEQARGSRDIDARTDVFALGCVLYLCLTGRPAFAGPNVMVVLAKVVHEVVPRVREQRPDVPEALDALCARMLAKDPDRRPRSGAEVAAALAALQSIDGSGAPLGAAAAPQAMPEGERRALSVVLLAPSPEGEDLQAIDALRTVAEPYGGHLDWLADGSVIVAISARDQAATDHAVRSARFALALSQRCPGRPAALAMGRSETSGTLPAGEVIERAARLLSVGAAPGHDGGEWGSTALAQTLPVAIDEEIAGLLDVRFAVLETPSGIALQGEREAGPGARTLLGKATSCVGREVELTRLEAILTECVEEPAAQAVLVTAQAGAGKSRLAAELLLRLRRAAATSPGNAGEPSPTAIWQGRGDPQRAGSALELLGQALRGALGLREAQPLDERRNELRARVAEHVPERDRTRVAEFLGEIVGTSFPDDASPLLRAARQDEELMAEQMRAAFVDFLRAETAARPVLLVLEDLQWSDGATVAFVDAALRDLPSSPWMVLALGRPEVHERFASLWTERRMQEIRLKPLGRKASERLVRQVLGDGVGAETVERLVQRADGHASHLEELIRAAAGGKASAAK